jgi:hypothetical protein
LRKSRERRLRRKRKRELRKKPKSKMLRVPRNRPKTTNRRNLNTRLKPPKILNPSMRKRILLPQPLYNIDPRRQKLKKLLPLFNRFRSQNLIQFSMSLSKSSKSSCRRLRFPSKRIPQHRRLSLLLTHPSNTTMHSLLLNNSHSSLLLMVGKASPFPPKFRASNLSFQPNLSREVPPHRMHW